MAGTGASSGKRAGRLAGRLKASGERRQELQLINDRQDAIGSLSSVVGAYGLPGFESSGIQGVLSSVTTQGVDRAGTQRMESGLLREAKKNAKRAKEAAGQFKIAMAVLTVVTMGAASAFGAAAGAVASNSAMAAASGAGSALSATAIQAAGSAAALASTSTAATILTAVGKGAMLAGSANSDRVDASMPELYA
jgi:hypothetical protein